MMCVNGLKGKKTMAANNQPPINVGLNIQGNALGTVQQLTDRMLALRDTAAQVGEMLSKIDTKSKNLPTAQSLKNAYKQVDLLTTSAATLENRIYKNLTKADRAASVNAIVRNDGKAKYSNSQTMIDTLNRYDPRVVKEALEIRKALANDSGDIRKIKEAERALKQLKTTLKELSSSYQGLAFVKQQSDTAIQKMMSQTAGQLAIQKAAEARQFNQFVAGAKESAIQKYMASPSTIRPVNPSQSATASQAEIQKYMRDNAAKTSATQRLMGSLYLQNPKIGSPEAEQLSQHSKMLNQLDNERVKLQTLQNLKRTNLKIDDEQLNSQRKINDTARIRNRVESLRNTTAQMSTNNAQRLGSLSQEDFNSHQITMVQRLAQAKQLMRSADLVGSNTLKVEAEKILGIYQREIDLINQQKKALADKAKLANENTRIDNRVGSLQNGNLSLKRLTQSQVDSMDSSQILEKQIGLNQRLSVAKREMFKAEELGNTKARDDAEKVTQKIQKQLDLLNQRKKVLAEEARVVKQNEELNKRLASRQSGNLRVEPLSQSTIMGMDSVDLASRKNYLNNKIRETSRELTRSEELGNAKAKKDAQDLIKLYQRELELLQARNQEVNRQKNGNGIVNRYNEMSTGESSGALLGIQGLIARNYMLWGAFMGSITGSYAFLRDFEVALKQTQAISQATDTQMQSLKESILNVGENSRFSAIEITEAATTLAQAGFSLSEIQKTLESVTLLATATGSSLKETVDIATASLGAFQLSADNMPRIVNQITQAMNLSKLDIQKFQLAVQYAGNAASDAGLNFEELLASVSTVANAGVRSGSTLGTGFRQLLTDLISPSTKFEAILKRLGLTTSDIDVRTNGLVGSLKKLKEAGFTTTDAYESFEVRSVAFYTALANNTDMYDSLSTNLNSNTAAMDANEIQMNSLGAQTDRMFNQFKALAETSGGTLRTSLTQVVRLIGDLTTGLVNLTGNGTGKAIVQTVAMTAALTGGIIVVRSMVSAVTGLVAIYKAQATAATGAAAATTAATTAMARSNVIIFGLSLAISAAVAAFEYFSKGNKNLKNAVEESQTAVNSLTDVTSGLQGAITEVTNKIGSLESRFENIKNDPTSLSIEMENLRSKASELGITLQTDLNGSIESVKRGWQELRIELGKELEMNLERQVEQLRGLAIVTAQMRAQDAMDKKAGTTDDARKNNFGKIYSYNNLSNASGVNTQKAYQGGFIGDGALPYAATNNVATSETIFSEALKATKSKTNAADLNKQYIGMTQFLASNPSAENLKNNSPAFLKASQQMLTELNAAYNQYATVINDAKRPAQERENAKVSAASIAELTKDIQKSSGYIGNLASLNKQADMLQRQAGGQGYSNQIGQQLMDGSPILGGQYGTGKIGSIPSKLPKPKQISADGMRNLRELMPTIQKAAAKYDLPVDVLVGWIAQESGFSRDNSLLGDTGKKDANGKAIKTSAIGLTQMTKAATEHVGFNRKAVETNPEVNIMAGAAYLANQRKDTDGTIIGGLRAYYGGKGGWKNDASGDYAARILSNTQSYQNGTLGKEVLTKGKLDPELAKNIENRKKLQIAYNDVQAQLKALPKDIAKRTAEQNKAYDDLMQKGQGLTDNMNLLSTSINNSLKNGQSEEDALRKGNAQKSEYNEQVIQAEIDKLERELKVVYDPERDGTYTDNKAKIEPLLEKRRTLQRSLAKMKSDRELLSKAEYAANSTDLTVPQAVQDLADLALQSQYAKIDEDTKNDREQTLRQNAKKFTDMIKSQNTQFIQSIKEGIENELKPINNALTANEFFRQRQTWDLEDSSGVTGLRKDRNTMDDPRFKRNYSDIQREELDREIERRTNEFSLQTVGSFETDKALKESALAKSNEEIDKARERFTEQKLRAEKLIAAADPKDATELKTSLDKMINDFTDQITKLENDSQGITADIRELESKITTIKQAGSVETYSFGDMAKGIANKAVRDDESASGYQRDIEASVGSINTAFNNLIDTALKASDNVDDFFKILTGGSSKSREAFKAFGYDIISTIAKVVQNRLVNQFVSWMLNGIFGDSMSSSGNSQSAVMAGQKASGGSGGSTLWQTALSSVVQAGVGAFTGWLGGAVGGSSLQAGIGASNVNSAVGADYMGGGTAFKYMANGGEVVGGKPYTDSVPIMSMPGEYYLPKSTTDVVGKQFLTGLKDDPHGMMNSLKANNLASRPQVNKSVQSNIYMVAPSAVPSTLGANDIVVAVSDNISRNGELKQLIKQVSAE